MLIVIYQQPARRYFCNVSISLSCAALMKVFTSSTGKIDEINFRSLFV